MQQRETKEVIIITWKSGLKQVFEKTQNTYDMIVFEYEDIEEMEYSEIVTVKEEPKQEPQQSWGAGGFRYLGAFDKSIESFIQENQNNDELEIGDSVFIGEVMYKCISIDPLEFSISSQSGGGLW